MIQRLELDVTHDPAHLESCPLRTSNSLSGNVLQQPGGIYLIPEGTLIHDLAMCCIGGCNTGA